MTYQRSSLRAFDSAPIRGWQHRRVTDMFLKTMSMLTVDLEQVEELSVSGAGLWAARGLGYY